MCVHLLSCSRFQLLDLQEKFAVNLNFIAATYILVFIHIRTIVHLFPYSIINSVLYSFVCVLKFAFVYNFFPLICNATRHLNRNFYATIPQYKLWERESERERVAMKLAVRRNGCFIASFRFLHVCVCLIPWSSYHAKYGKKAAREIAIA